MSTPFSHSRRTTVPEYAAPMAISVMAMAMAFALAPEAMTRCFLHILAQINFFFSGQAV